MNIKEVNREITVEIFNEIVEKITTNIERQTTTQAEPELIREVEHCVEVAILDKIRREIVRRVCQHTRQTIINTNF